MKSEHSELRAWANQLVAGDETERRAAGRAILMLLDDLASQDAELESARGDAAETRAALDVARREAAELEIAIREAAEAQAAQLSWRDRFMRPRGR